MPLLEPQYRCVSVPGKVILMGEHAAVYGEPAVVAALGLRTTAEVVFDVELERRAEGVALELPDLQTSIEVAWEQIDRLRDRAFEQSERYLSGQGEFVALHTLASLEHAPAAALFVAAALGEVCAAFAQYHGRAQVQQARSSVHSVRVVSQAPLSAGCGSSAAVATAVVASFEQTLRTVLQQRGQTLVADAEQPEQLEQREQEQNAIDVEATALRVEHYQHGRPSGVDTAAVLRGGVLRVQQKETLELETVSVAEGVMGGFLVAMTGTSSEATGVVVDAVRQARREDSVTFDRRFAALGALSGELVTALGTNDIKVIGPILSAGERHLEALGVVPYPVRELVRRIESKGAFAKVSGAGALHGPGAGILLVYDPHSHIDLGSLKNDFPSITLLEASLGAEGLRHEQVIPGVTHGVSPRLRMGH